jgi:predicted signal transduction protein with EAL and GGDEF domain
VLAKLEEDDRAVVLAALERAERNEAELRYLADHDSLTGLLDRRRFRAELDQYVSFSARYGGRGAVMIVDIDGLKGVNDALGHHAGDNLIRQVAESVRPTSESPAATISVGITMFGAGAKGAGSEAVLVAADQAMYTAKEGGRNQIALFRDPGEPQRDPERRQTTAARIRDAITDDRLSLHTQPIRSLASGGIERYELLLRMTSEDGELLPAASFIEAAERSGMVQELDRWVVGRARELLAERERRGAPLSLHVNISGASLTDVSVLEFIERRLDEGGVDPSSCTFEITETANVQDYDAAGGFADRLTDFGCQVAIDDYGAGFGPFHYLKRIPFDLIKIDGSFVRDMPRSDADQLTVQAIVQIARGLGKTTIAEYVQDDLTAKMLLDYGVDMAQGFHLGRPVGLDEAFAETA